MYAHPAMKRALYKTRTLCRIDQGGLVLGQTHFHDATRAPTCHAMQQGPDQVRREFRVCRVKAHLDFVPALLPHARLATRTGHYLRWRSDNRTFDLEAICDQRQRYHQPGRGRYPVPALVYRFVGEDVFRRDALRQRIAAAPLE